MVFASRPSRIRPRLVVVLVTLATALATSPVPVASAAAPANDDFVNSEVLGSLPSTVTQSTADATREGSEPSSSCESVFVVGATVWFEYTATAPGILTADTEGSDYDTILAVWTGSALDNLIEVGCDDDGGLGTQSSLSFTAQAGVVYRFQVGGYNGAVGSLTFNLASEVSPPPIVANDNFADAEILGPLPHTVTQSTVDATLEAGEPGPSYTEATVWFGYTAAATGLLIADTDGSDFETRIGVWTGTSLGTLTEVDTKEFYTGPDYDQVRVEFTAQAGVRYWFQVGGYYDAWGNLTFTVTAPGSISGTVVDAATDEPIALLVVRAVVGSTTQASTTTDASGHYSLQGLTAGDYMVMFSGPNYLYLPKWWDDHESSVDADPVTVTWGDDTTGIDARLILNDDPAAGVYWELRDCDTNVLTSHFPTTTSCFRLWTDRYLFWPYSENPYVGMIVTAPGGGNASFPCPLTAPCSPWEVLYGGGVVIGYYTSWYISGEGRAPGTYTLQMCGGASSSLCNHTLMTTTFTVTVEDTTAPVVTVPDDVVVVASGAAGAVVSWAGPTASDAVDGSVAVSCVPVSGSTFGLGDTVVTCTATDAAGNIGSGSFTVTVVGDGQASFEVVDPGEEVSTDGSGDGATPAAPVETAVTSPTGGSVVVVTAPSGTDPSGYQLFGQTVTITAPAASASNPLVLRFLIDVSVIPDGTSFDDIDVFRNGVLVADCTGAPQAIPDPCVESRGLVSGDVEITVLTSSASQWGFGIEVAASVTRYAGSNRYGTAAAISAGDFPDPSSVSTVFVATGLNYPDALAGAAVAGMLGAPLLLVGTNSIPGPTAIELARLSPDTIVILGGTSAVSGGVEIALGAYASSVTRLAGANRYATAVQISQYGYAGTADTVIVATGAGFADALAGGPAAVALGGPVLLTDPATLPGVVAAEITRLSPSRIVVVGGVAAVSATVFNALQAIQANTVRISGSNRYATAVAISEDAFAGGSTRVYVATGLNFPDALAGAAAAGWYGAPVLLVPGTSIPGTVSAEITRLGASQIIVLGGIGVVSTGVEVELGVLIGL